MQIAGNINNIKMFSPDHCNTEAEIIEKGIKGSTKHFVVPNKNKSKKKPSEISYQTLDLDSKLVFIYGINY